MVSPSHWRFLIEQYLHQCLYETARFYAERYYAELPNEESLYLLANCYFRQGKLKQTHLILSESKYLNASENKYLFALVCVQLGKYDEAEYVLHVNNRLIVEEDFTLQNFSDIPGGAAGLFLMGKICRQQQRNSAAITYFKLALERDPFLWNAVLELSEIGVDFKLDQLILSVRDQHDPAKAGSITATTTTSQMTTRSKTADLTPSLPSKHYPQQYYSTERKEMDSEAAKAFLLHTAENLQPKTSSHHSLSASAAVVRDLDHSMNNPSAVSMKLPFATPSSLPSPITTSMLSGGRNILFPSDAMVVSPYPNINANSNNNEISGRAPSTIHPHHSYSHTNSSLYPPPYNSSMIHTNERTVARGMTLFGGPTPSEANHSTPLITSASGSLISRSLQQPHFSLSEIPPGAPSSEFIESNVSTIMEMNTEFNRHITGGGPSTTTGASATGGGGERRRVSFGPTARLSFSGAFDSHLPPYPSHSLPDSFEDGLLSEKIVTAETDEHPHKLQRSDPRLSPASRAQKHLTATTSSEGSRPPPSPFPMPVMASPIVSESHHLSGFVEDDLPLTSHSSSHNRLHHHRGGNYDSVLYEESLADGKVSSHQVTSAPTQTANISNPTSSSTTTAKPATLSLYEIDLSLWQLVAIFAQAAQQVSSYYCLECIETLQKLPPTHYHSALVSQLIGKACLERNEYTGATIAFQEMRRLEPYRLQGMELYSSALWHLREEKSLAALAQQVLEIDRHCPETWCVLGNCFSLQKETDLALRFFQRALQIDSSFAYAHTLCGHEHVNNEDMEKAITSFRMAILCNERHYNAWYGLGSIYYRQERFEMSEYHFRRARAINPRSSVLDCYLGMALNAQGSPSKIIEALDVLSEASRRDPNNPQLRFQRAHILLSQDRYEEALEELLIVEQKAPKEPPVHAMLGQIYQRVGNVTEALLHLNIAMDLDPKEMNSLKSIMENFEEPQLVV